MSKEREQQHGLEKTHLNPQVRFFCSFFMFSTYFIPGWPPHYHPTTTTSTTTSNHDDHYKGLKTRRVLSPWYFHTLTLIPTTTSTCQHTTAVFGDNVWRMGARDASTSRSQVSFSYVYFTKKSKVDYAYYNDTGRNGSRERERAEKGVDEHTTHWHPVTSSRYTSATI